MNSNVGTAFQPPSESLAKLESFDLYACTTMELDFYCLLHSGWFRLVENDFV